MATWDETTLATLDTITRHEQEINELSGKKTRPVLYWDGVGSAPTITFDIADVTSALTYSETNYATERTVTAKVLTLAAGYYTKIELYDAEGELLDVYSLTEGSGNFIYGGTSDAELSADLWLSYDVLDTWQNKITVAKERLKNDIETRLGRQGYTVNFADGETLIDVVTNLDTFTLAHDYLSLHLIFTDLWLNSNSEMFKEKARFYWAEYQAELTNCFYRLAIDPNADGNPSTYGDWSQGKISR